MGVFQEGWRQDFGADADPLKTPADIDSCASAGYTFYTVDPGEYVLEALWAIATVQPPLFREMMRFAIVR